MMSSTKKISIQWTILALSITLMAGCSKANIPPKVTSGNTQNQTGVTKSPTNKPPVNNGNISNSSGNTVSNTGSVATPSQKKILSDILKLSKEGKLINCEFGAKTGIVENVEKKWGKADKTDYVASAKGTYITYLKENVVFGFNKGAQIFEVRSLSKDLGKISITMVKNYLGTPGYDVKTKTEEIIGYKVSPDFKLLFVFPKVSANNTSQFLLHYSVLYPQGTVNSMADDPGRQW
jgi:hypothetical protein